MGLSTAASKRLRNSLAAGKVELTGLPIDPAAEVCKERILSFTVTFPRKVDDPPGKLLNGQPCRRAHHCRRKWLAPHNGLYDRGVARDGPRRQQRGMQECAGRVLHAGDDLARLIGALRLVDE